MSRVSSAHERLAHEDTHVTGGANTAQYFGRRRCPGGAFAVRGTVLLWVV